MNIVVDENIPRRTVDALRAMGHAVTDIRGTPDQGCDDEVLWQRAQDQRALLIATDKGFLRRGRQDHCGILVVCLRQPNRLKIHTRVLQALAQFSDAEWPGLAVTMRDTVQSARRAPMRGEIPDDAT